MPTTLPIELVITILSIAAACHRPTAARLCLVSTWVQDLIQPILYRVLTLKHATSSDAHKWLYTTKFHAFIRCFGVVNGPVMFIHLSDAEKQPVSVRNFATDSAFYVVASDIEELHLFGRRLPSLDLPHLTRLHICLWRVPMPDLFAIEDFLRHSRLTHIAFSVPEDLLGLIMSTIIQLLKEQEPLVLLYLRLLPSSSVVICGATDHNTLDGRLASVGDNRLVAKRVSIDAHPTSLFDEWEHNALCGESIWDWAEKN